jgi:hypothetical protein
MSSYREQGLKAKEAMIGIVEQRSSLNKKKKPKPFAVEFRRRGRIELPFGAWRIWAKYPTLAGAQNVVDKKTKDHRLYLVGLYEFRIKP